MKDLQQTNGGNKWGNIPNISVIAGGGVDLELQRSLGFQPSSPHGGRAFSLVEGTVSCLGAWDRLSLSDGVNTLNGGMRQEKQIISTGLDETDVWPLLEMRFTAFLKEEEFILFKE